MIGLFHDKTRVVTEYLRGVASAYPQEVSMAVTEALASGYLIGLQKAWLLAVLREVPGSCAEIQGNSTLQIGIRIAESEDESWLPRVEAVRLLAHVGGLSQS